MEDFHHVAVYGGSSIDNQIRQIKKMGNVKDLMSMIPGMGKAIKDIDIDENALEIGAGLMAYLAIKNLEK